MKEMIQKIGLGLSALALMAFTAIGLVGAPASAQTTTDWICQGVWAALPGTNCNADGTPVDTVFGWAGMIVGWILTAVGIICVVFIIFGGIRYATSGGDAEKVKKAKNTLLYAIIGLAVALLAGLIVGIVVSAANNATR